MPLLSRPMLATLALSSLAACGSGSLHTRLPPASDQARGDAPVLPYMPKPVRFENPGGMWMPHQMAAHEAKLRELGLTLDPHELEDPTSKTLQAIVSLGGCSASFVSPEGLVVTNHHCATGALQMNSTPGANLLKLGFQAKTLAEERSNGPTARVFVTDKVSDVTTAVRLGLEAQKDDVARFKLVEARQKDLTARCEKARTGTRCSVASFYEGAKFYLIEQLEIRDVRLVFAPEAGVGNFGGEIDNWRWPRHTGDFTFFRAYVGKDGQPADYAPDNVPYRPKSHLRFATTPLRESDLVMVAGYPGRTYSNKTRVEVEEAVTFGYPRRQKMCEDYLAALAVVSSDPAAAIVATPLVRRYGNALTNTKGQLEGLVKDGLLAQKAKSEEPLRAAHAKILDAIAAVIDEAKKTREADAELNGEFLTPKLLGAAQLIVKMAQERPKADAERDPEVQERNWPRHRQALDALDKQYHRSVDEALLGTALARAAKVPAAERSKAYDLTLAMGKTPHDLYEGTTLDAAATRRALFDKATLAELRTSRDPLIRWALAIRPLVTASELREQKVQGKMLLLKTQYFDAVRALSGKEIAPDANSTLRITYGTVRGYKAKPDAPMFRPFTMLGEVVAKNTGVEPFDVPRDLLAAYRAHKTGGYTDAQLAEQVPVDFLADLHITGGNSGSATLNAKGELTGLAFDGNYESLASDWLFKPEVTRSIHVDSRYILWLLDAVYAAKPLLHELGITPRY